MPTLRFRLFRAGYSALDTEHTASSPQELADKLSVAPLPDRWPALLAVFRCTAPAGSNLPGWWFMLSYDPLPLLGPATTRAVVEALWPLAVEKGHDYEREPQSGQGCGSRTGI